MSITITFYKYSTSSEGDSYASPVFAYDIIASRDLKRAVDTATEMFCNQFNVEDWRDIADYRDPDY